MDEINPWDVELLPSCLGVPVPRPHKRLRVKPFSYQGKGFTIRPMPRQDRVHVACPPVGGLKSPAARMAARHAVHQYAAKRSEFLMTPRGAIRFIEAMGETPPPTRGNSERTVLMSETKLTYGVKIEEIDGDHVVTVRDLPEVQTSGDTPAEAILLASDAIEVAVAGRIEDGEALATPSPVLTGEQAVTISKPSAAPPSA